MKEWEIPWDELKMGDKLGTGHFGTVYSGYWHGDVAIKVLNMDYLGDEKMLENFKSEVSVISSRFLVCFLLCILIDKSLNEMSTCELIM